MGDSDNRDQTVTPISAVLADVDGTLVTKDKVLTERTLHAVSRLRERGIVFTITAAGHAARHAKLVEPLRLTMPMAAFNGGVIVLPDLSGTRRAGAARLRACRRSSRLIEAHGLDVWIYARPTGTCARVTPRASIAKPRTVQSEPTVVTSVRRACSRALSRSSASA